MAITKKKAVTGKRPTRPSRGAAKATARKRAPAARGTARKKTAPKLGGKKGRALKATSGKEAARRARQARRAVQEHAPLAVPGLSDEDQIRAAKYLPRELPKRLFEEERFLFPETYGVNRVRLLVRDPEWIFAYWDVDPGAMKDLGKSLGERALALSRLTLRVLDPVSGGSSDILLPPGARWWYVRTDSARRTYRAVLGVTLPSGDFRALAESNTVVTPRVGPSAQRASRRMSYRDAREMPPSAAKAAGVAESATGQAGRPLEAESVDGSASPARRDGKRGGASDVFRPGGASDTFRR